VIPAKGSDELIPEQVEVCADLHLRPYSGDEDDTDGLRSFGSAAWNHCVPRLCHGLYAREEQTLTLAVRRLKDGDTASSVPR